MIKKHLCTCMVVLLALVLSKMFIYSTPINKEAKNTIPSGTLSVVEAVKKETGYSTLNFADEYLPTGDVNIEKKIKRSLKAYSFEKLRTYKLHKNAKAWFPIIEPVLEEYNIPEDFKYIPLVESGLIEGTSHRGASGLWQFMPATARAFGLKVNGAVDERHDVQKSTVAACKYLNALYKEFGNWTLVAAAYNVGSGSLRKTIRMQNQDDYYQLKLNKETSNYVYKLISTKEVIENPWDYGYKIEKRDTKLALEDVANANENNQM
ncbi:lytic transglycosylase domain-containing protein [Olivibacter sp. SDN3]|uniref:lytic transglycosylase domain-containing protein n=1 Tax=Olivibacter sp. SDN3 TaxID=2764720 RepID=UPI00165126B6|nr:lytic transglycosylase domain-containing protein [Olivibacter sp. SDN3]QNL50063.1 lytic transglycosylase domain-containing protein [Olivibacter sp. SDN3]